MLPLQEGDLSPRGIRARGIHRRRRYGKSGAWAGSINNNSAIEGDFLGNGGTTLINFNPEDHASARFSAPLSMRTISRKILVGTYDTGVSDVSGNDCARHIRRASAKSDPDDFIFVDGFDSSSLSRTRRS